MKKVVIAGGTGFLGNILCQHFVNLNFEVVILTRKKQIPTPNILYAKWDGETRGDWCQALEGAEVLINLCGKSVDCRYTEENKQLIYDTRLKSTKVLGQAISACTDPPKTWMNASSATIYRHAEDREMDEETGELGTGFSVDVCQKWEETFFAAKVPETRQIALRIAIVLGKNGGALQPLKRLSLFGLGGIQGNGNQYFSWIHEDDFTAAMQFLLQNESLHGIFNLSAPHPVTNEVFMRTLRKKLKVPFGIPTPKFLLEIGARMIRTETELILKSRRVVPRKLRAAGFAFQYSQLDDGLGDLI
jgi:uncharacterized protein (TIGR01777 family)